jgi:carbamoyltransferase
MKGVIGLNVSANAAAVVIRSDGSWCALEEERFSRVKHNRDPAACLEGFSGAWFPRQALAAVMAYLELRPADIVAAGFACTGEFPTRRGPRLAEVVGERLGQACCQLSHHMAHAWSVNDGELREGDMISVCDGSGSKLFSDEIDDNAGWERLSTFIVRNQSPQRVMVVTPRFYHSPRWQRVVRSINSLGFFYQWMAAQCVPPNNELEGSMMALAAYGSDSELRELIEREIVLYPDGGYLLRLNELAVPDLHDTWPSAYPATIFGERLHGPQDLANLAWAAQHVFAEVLTNAVVRQQMLLCPRQVAVSGGSFLNCVLNAQLEPLVHRLILRPAMHDAGVAYGCALAVRHRVGWNHPLDPDPSQSAAVGICAGADRAEDCDEYVFGEKAECVRDAAHRLSRGEVVAVIDGRCEFGPRALGHRSILASPAFAGMKDRLNQAKQRADFRPFALAILEESTPEVFGRPVRSPFMIQSFPVREEWRSRLAEALHVDGTTRVQTVSSGAPLHDLIVEFQRRDGGVPALINTSLNEKGLPIARTLPECIYAATRAGAAAVYHDYRIRYIP